MMEVAVREKKIKKRERQMYEIAVKRKYIEGGKYFEV